MKWMPIETVPKDGTLVLVFQPDEGIRTARWIAHTDEWWEQVSANRKELRREVGGYWDTEGIYAPTYWMPLPPAPTQDEDAEHG